MLVLPQGKGYEELELRFTFTTGEFGVVYKARLTRSSLRKTECEIVAVKTIKGNDIKQL